MTDYVFDTTVIIDYFRRRPEVRPYFQRLREGSDTAAFSTVTEAELWEGLRPNEEERHEAILRLLRRIAVNSGIARAAGRLRRQYAYDSQGKQHNDWLPMPDALIAATAIVSRRTLVSRDREAFARFQGLAPAPVEVELYHLSPAS